MSNFRTGIRKERTSASIGRVTNEELAAMFPAEPKYTPEQCADSLEERRVPCQFCDILIQWGRTTSGKRAPFDSQAPHPNHWITCPEADRARAHFRRKGTPPAPAPEAPPETLQSSFLTEGGQVDETKA